MPIPRTAFRVWADSFDLDEIDELAFLSVGLTVGELKGNTVSQKARNLQENAVRQGEPIELALFETIIEARPHLEEKLVAAGWNPDRAGAAAAGGDTSPANKSGGDGGGHQISYENFDLRIRSKDADGRYRMEVSRNPMGMEMFEDIKQTFPLDDYNFTDLIDYLTDLVGDSGDAKEVGQQMWRLLFPGRIGEILFASLNQVRSENKGLRIRLRIDPPELSKLPWEYCYHSEFGFLALNPNTPIVRYISQPFEGKSVTVPNPVRVLVAIAAPSDQPPLSVDEEARRIEQWLSVLGDRVDLTVLRHTTPQRLQAALGRQPHIVHFIGHGTMSEELGQLVLEDDFGLATLRDSDQIRSLLRGSGVKVVVLNACKSAAGDVHAAFAGMAPALVQADVPAVIAMQFNVPDETALGFTRDLYRYLVSGYPLDTAVTEMRKGAFNNANDKTFWGIPVLFMRSPDGALWPPDRDLMRLFAEAAASAAERVGPTLADLVQQILDEVNKLTGDIDERDLRYIVRGLEDGQRALSEASPKIEDVEYYLSRVVDDLNRSSAAAAQRAAQKVTGVINQAREKYG